MNIWYQKFMINNGRTKRDSRDRRREKISSLGWIICTIHEIDKQQGPTIQHRELYSISYDKRQWKRMWKKIYMYNWITLLYTQTLTKHCKLNVIFYGKKKEKTRIGEQGLCSKGKEKGWLRLPKEKTYRLAILHFVRPPPQVAASDRPQL